MFKTPTQKLLKEFWNSKVIQKLWYGDDNAHIKGYIHTDIFKVLSQSLSKKCMEALQTSISKLKLDEGKMPIFEILNE